MDHQKWNQHWTALFSYKKNPIMFYMKYSVNPGRISSFVVGRAGSEYGLPVAVIAVIF